MKHWRVAFLAALSPVTVAHAAVSLAQDGLGEGLLFPYATIVQGQTSEIAIENTRDHAKAIKYYVRDSRDGVVVAAGTAYIPPRAEWTLTLFDPEEPGRVALQVGGSGCMAQASDKGLKWLGIPGAAAASWTHETVSVEIVEVGTLDAKLSQAMQSTCDPIWERWYADADAVGRWRRDSHADVRSPGGGLRGSARLFDVEDRTTFEYPALAFRGLSRVARHEDPDWSWPQLADIAPDGDRFVHAVLPDGRHLRYPRKRGLDALAVLLAARHVETDYLVHPLRGERTDIVVALPFRQGYVGDPAAPPFTGPECENVAATAMLEGDRIESRSLALCDRATVLRLRHPVGGSPCDVVADERAVDIPVERSGVLRIDFSDAPNGRMSRPDLDYRCWRGLPAWVLTLAADETIKEGSRPRTYVRATVAIPAFDIVPCG